jgi:hypothetical protein
MRTHHEKFLYGLCSLCCLSIHACTRLIALNISDAAQRIARNLSAHYSEIALYRHNTTQTQRERDAILFYVEFNMCGRGNNPPTIRKHISAATLLVAFHLFILIDR